MHFFAPDTPLQLLRCSQLQSPVGSPHLEPMLSESVYKTDYERLPGVLASYTCYYLMPKFPLYSCKFHMLSSRSPYSVWTNRRPPGAQEPKLPERGVGTQYDNSHGMCALKRHINLYGQDCVSEDGCVFCVRVGRGLVFVLSIRVPG